MQFNWKTGLLGLLIATCFIALLSVPCHAQGLGNVPLGIGDGLAAPQLTLSVETPVGLTPALCLDRTTSVFGTLTCPLDKQGRFCAFGSASYGFGDRGSRRSIVNFNDVWRGGLSCAVTPDLTAYTYYERRFSVNTQPDRLMCGLTWRCNFRQ